MLLQLSKRPVRPCTRRGHPHPGPVPVGAGRLPESAEVRRSPRGWKPAGRAGSHRDRRRGRDDRGGVRRSTNDRAPQAAGLQPGRTGSSSVGGATRRPAEAVVAPSRRRSIAGWSRSGCPGSFGRSDVHLPGARALCQRVAGRRHPHHRCDARGMPVGPAGGRCRARRYVRRSKDGEGAISWRGRAGFRRRLRGAAPR
jgi:hypothetical protein